MGTDVVTYSVAPPSQRNYSLIQVMLRLPGADSVSTTIPTRAWTQANQVNPAFSRLGDNILRDVIDGSEIRFAANGELPDPANGGGSQPPWWDQLSHMTRAIANLPGVHDYKYVQGNAVRFHVANDEARAALERMVVDELPDSRKTRVVFATDQLRPDPSPYGAHSERQGA